MSFFDDTRLLRRLAQVATKDAGFSRRSILMGAAGTVGGAALAGMPTLVNAEEITPPTPGKKMRIGVPLTYGPFNQPWRRGCWQIVKAFLDAGGEVVTVRGEPTKASEQAAARVGRGIDALVMASTPRSLRRPTSQMKLTNVVSRPLASPFP